MASLTRSQLKTSSNSTYDTNGVGGITATEVRTFNDDLIDSLITNDLTSSMAVANATNALTASSVANGVLTPLNQFTASATIRLNNLETTSASVNVSISNLNGATGSYAISASVAAVDAAQQQQINSLIAASSSYANSASFAASQLVQDGRLNNLESTSASLLIETSNLETFSASALISINALNTNSGSVNTSISNLNSATQSLQGQLTTIGGQSGSWVTESETASFATTGSNNFVGNQRISGDLFVTSSNQIGFIRTGGLISNASIKIGDDGGNDVTLTSNDVNVNLNGGDVKIYNASAGNGIQMEGPDPLIGLRDTSAPNNPFIALTNKNNRLEIVDTTSTIVTMNTASFNIPSASFTASLNQGYVWVGDNNNRTVLVSTSSFGSTTDLTSLNSFTASQYVSNSYFATTASFNSYTSSTNVRLNNLESTSASLLVETQNLELFSASALVSINALNSATASYVTETESGSFLITASFDNGTRNLTFTKGNNTTFAVNIPDVSGSAGDFVTTSSFNAYTQSNDQRVTSLESNSASVNTSISNINQFTSSANQRLTSIESVSGSWITESETASFARTNVDNNFTANQTFTNITAVSASFTYVQTLYETSSVIYSSGSNQFGDELSDIQTLSGSVKVQGSLTVNGTPVLTSSVDISGLTTTASFNAYTQSNNQRVSSLEVNSASVNTSITNINSATASLFTSASLALVTASASGNTITFTKGDASTFNVSVDTGSATTTIYDTVYTGESITKGDPLYISGAQGANPIVYKADASNPAKMPVTYVSNETIGAGTTTEAIILGHIEGIDLTGYTAGQTIYVAEGGGWSANLPSGSNSVTQLLGVVTKAGSGGKGLVLNPGPAQLPGLDSGYLWAGDVNNQPTQVTTASFVSSASFNTYTSSNDQKVNSLIAATGSYATSAITASSLITASVSLNTITFTKGDGTTFPITVNTGSGGGGGTTDTGSLMVTGSVAGNVLTFTKGDASTFDLIVVASGSAPAGTVSSSAQILNYGIFATTGSNSFNGDQTITGSVRAGTFIVGSIPQAPTIQSLDSGTPAGNTSLQINAGASGSFSLRTLYGAGFGKAIVEAYDTYPDYNTGGKIEALSNGGINAFGYGGPIQITGSTLQMQGFTYPTTDGTSGQVLTTNGSKVLSFTTISGGGAVGATLGANTFTGSQTIQDANLTISNTGSAFLTINGATDNNILFNSPSTAFTSYGAFNFTNNNSAGGSGSLQFTVASASVNFYTRDGFIFGRAETGPVANGFVKMNTISGSLVLTPSGFNNNAADLLHLSGSSNSNNINLIFKNTNTAADTIISGSNNIFTNPAAPTAGFKRYIGGSNNIINTANAPQISGSMGFSPTMTQNYLVAATFNMRGPVSSSAWTITNNIIQGSVNIGSSAANNAEKAVAGLTMNGNSINGQVIFIANRSLHTQTNTIANNIITSTTTLTAASSSIIYTGNIGGITVTNGVSGSGNAVISGSNSMYLNANIFGGAGNSIITSGSSDPGDISGNEYTREVVYNTILGSGNSVRLPYDLTGSNTIHNTLIAGLALSITGSSPGVLTATPTKGGSAFVGRYNAQDGNRAQTAETVFAIGTGTSTSTRKTGFLIDSGSNTFVEGTFNVSGSTTMTGSLLVSGAFETTQDITIQDASGNPTLKIGRGAGNQPSNLRFGVQALATAPGLNNIAIGNSAMQYSSQSLATENIAIGGESLQYNQEGQQIAIGTSALRYTTTGKENLAVGAFAMQNNITGTQNIAVGFNSLYNHTDGTKNIAIGPSAAQNFRSGSNNIFIGYQTANSISGSNNVILGAYNGTGETINNNIILADGAGNKELQFSGSTWTTENTFNVSGSLGASNEIRMGRGVDKPTNKVTVGTGGLIVSNSLVTADSYIFATNDTTVGNYSPVVSNITAGSFSLSNGGYGGNIDVMYMIVNPY